MHEGTCPNAQGLQVTRLMYVAIMTGPAVVLMVVAAVSSQQTAEVPVSPSDFEA